MISWARSIRTLASPSDYSPVLPPAEPSQIGLVRLLEELGVDASPVLSSSTSTALCALASIFTSSHAIGPTSRPAVALHLATLLSPLPDSSNSKSNSKSPSSPSFPDDPILRLSLALLFGLDRLDCTEMGSVEEELVMRLVELFVTGKVRQQATPSVPSEALEAFEKVGQALLGGARISGGGTSVWKLTENVLIRLEERILAQAAVERVTSCPRLRRVLINVTYLLALFSSSLAESSSSSLRPQTAQLFSTVIQLGLSSLPTPILGTVPSLATATSAPDSPLIAHASSLIWKSRRRLELSGRLAAALAGLPNEGKDYARWNGNAVEKAKVAEKSLLLNRRLSSLRRSGLTRLECGSSGQGEEEEGGLGELLAAPRRLKGKKIAHQRKGKYVPSLCSATPSSSSSSAGIRTPPSPYHSPLDRSSPHHYHSTFSSPSRRHDLSTTSLPSLQKKSSIDLLALNFSPRLPSTALGQATNPPIQAFTVLPSIVPPLKSATPIPLPTVLASHGIFSPVGQFHSMGEALTSRPSSPTVRIPERTTSFILRAVKSVADLQKRISVFAFPSDEDFQSDEDVLETAIPHARRLSSTSPTHAASPSFTIASLPSTTITSPIAATTPNLQIPILAFQPASHYDHDSLSHCGASQCDALARIWRPLSPRGDRIRGRGSNFKF